MSEFNDTHSIRHDHAKSHSKDHSVSAEDLSDKLERLREELEHSHTSHRERREHRHQSPSHMDKEFTKRAHETIHEILERLERQKHENDFTFNHSMPGIEDNGVGRVRHTYRLNPNLLDASGSLSLKQSHGNANLRHG
ncbi:hypothetical protein BGZ76_005883 [Entomortierella beljakovae]|nr:hypothetical protein BGZ76_005883 [Entomortierella beljakovae]